MIFAWIPLIAAIEGVAAAQRVRELTKRYEQQAVEHHHFGFADGKAAYEAMRNANAPPPRPRTDADREERMTRFVEWKRAQIARKWKLRALVTLSVLIGTPWVVFLVTLSWRAALAAVAN